MISVAWDPAGQRHGAGDEIKPKDRTTGTQKRVGRTGRDGAAVRGREACAEAGEVECGQVAAGPPWRNVEGAVLEGLGGDAGGRMCAAFEAGAETDTICGRDGGRLAVDVSSGSLERSHRQPSASSDAACNNS